MMSSFPYQISGITLEKKRVCLKIWVHPFEWQLKNGVDDNSPVEVSYMGVSINGGTPKWLVYVTVKSQSKMDDF